MKFIYKSLTVLLIILLALTANSNDTTRYTIYYGVSFTQVNPDLNNKIKTFGDYKFSNNMFNLGLAYRTKILNDLGYLFYFSTANYENENNQFTTTYGNSSFYGGIYYDVLNSSKFDLNISTLFGFMHENFKFKNNRDINSLDSLFSYSSESTIFKESLSSMVSFEFVYNFKFGLGLSLMANYTSQLKPEGYFFKDEIRLKDLKKYRSDFIDVQFGISYKL